MKRLWIIFLASLIFSAFSKIQGQGFIPYDLFLFSNLKLIYPEYAWNICINIVPIAYLWTLVSQEVEKSKEMKLAAWIVTGHLIDFFLECNQGWFSIGVYAISYDTIMFISLGLVVLKAMLNE